MDRYVHDSEKFASVLNFRQHTFIMVHECQPEEASHLEVVRNEQPVRVEKEVVEHNTYVGSSGIDLSSIFVSLECYQQTTSQ